MHSVRGKLAAVVVAASVIVFAAAPLANARDDPWYRYENSFFEAYSDAPEKKVRRLLSELENFRAAIVQVMGFAAAGDAVRSRVFIFDSSKDFRSVTGKYHVAGFAASIDGVPFLVMPIGGSKKLANMVIRHEYTHVLLGNDGHYYPTWFNEGFAEFMSATEFRSGGTTFTLGHATARGNSGASLVDWDELISDDFNMHTIQSAERRSNAYLQSWLLVHHLIVGEGAQHVDDLVRYLARCANGESSTVAFESEFGLSAAVLGNRLMKAYNGPVPMYVVEFQPGLQDHDFARSEADAAEVQAAIDELTRLAQNSAPNSMWANGDIPDLAH